MAKQSYSFGSSTTNTAQEIIVSTKDGREIVRATFPLLSLEPSAFRVFGLESEEWLMMEDERGKSLAMRYIRNRDCIDFAHYWNQKDLIKNKSKASILHRRRVKLMSKVLFHFYLSACQVKMLEKHQELKHLQPLCDSSVDHCSYSPDGWWAVCCCKHDLDYDEGGIEEDRAFFDRCFYRCLLRKAGPVIAIIYYVAVRLFGKDHFKNTGVLNGRRTCR
ncbi:MAG: hypothetical protein JNJ77_05770 [Planctomycetia bacterium]|nr:hypothetical protein [Planctomycetia bacterium]